MVGCPFASADGFEYDPSKSEDLKRAILRLDKEWEKGALLNRLEFLESEGKNLAPDELKHHFSDVSWTLWQKLRNQGIIHQDFSRLPPFVPGKKPVVGHLMMMKNKEEGLEKARKMALQHNLGDIVSLQLGDLVYCVMLTNAAHEEIHLKHGNKVQHRGFSYNSILSEFFEKAPGYGTVVGLVVTDYNYPLRKRREMLTAFIREFLPNMYITMARFCIQASLEFKTGEPIHAVKFFQKHIINMATCFSFGSKFQQSKVCMDWTRKCDEEMKYLLPNMPDYFSSWKLGRYLQRRNNRKAHNYLKERVKFLDPMKEVATQMIHEQGDDDEVSFLWALMKYMDGMGTDRDCFSLASSMSRAMGSTTVTNEWFWIEMFHHPEIYAKVKEEVRTKIPRDQFPTMEDLQKLPYLSMCIQETLRKHPPAPLSLSCTSEDVELKSGHMIPKGTVLVQSFYSFSVDESRWPNPEVFDPERFRDQGVSWNIPRVRCFGMGTRQCMGYPMAQQILQLWICVFVQNFDMELAQEKMPATDNFTNPVSTAFKEPLDYVMKATPLEDSYIFLETEDQLNARVKALKASIPKRKVDLDEAEVISSTAKLTVFYASQNGTSTNYAREIVAQGKQMGYAISLSNLSLFKPEQLNNLDMAIFCVSTHYEGMPCDPGVPIFEYLKTKPQLDLKFALFGSGDSNYERFNGFGQDMFELLTECGATPTCEAGVGDRSNNTDLAFANWTEAHLFPTLAESYETSAPKGGLFGTLEKPNLVMKVDFTQPPSTGGKKGKIAGKPAPDPEYKTCTLKSKSMVTDRCVRVEFKLDRTENYSLCQAFKIRPTNKPEAVAFMLGYLGAQNEADTLFTVKPKKGTELDLPFPLPNTLRNVLTHYVDLSGRLSKLFLQELAAFAQDPDDQAFIQAMGVKKLAEAYDSIMLEQGDSLVDVLKRCKSIHIDVDYFIQLSPRLKLQARMYTIASSAEAHPREVALVVTTGGKMVTPTREFFGLTSNLLPTLSKGDLVHYQLVDSIFRMPTDLTAPMIMVAGGSGLAPMLALLETREFLRDEGKDLGPCLLFFGIRTSEDYICQDMVERFNKNGACTAVHVATSRNTPRQYAQDLIKEEGDAVVRALQMGGYVYVCGGTGLGKSVRATLKELLVGAAMKTCQKKENAEAEAEAQADREMTGLTEEKRYMAELWSN
jgi:sulfite reductase alpha subunit-like flavoprotein/cytochrome P450